MARHAQDAPSGEADAGPAEDLSGDDDLLNHVLVNTIAQNNPKGLGLHPQTVGYQGPIVAYDEVLEILQRLVIEKGDIVAASNEFEVWSVFKAHLETRPTNVQKGRFVKHLRRYLMIYAPNSRVEIYKTDRYQEVTLHDELGVYATKSLEEGTILDELQGSVVKFPKSWEADLERGRLRELNDDEENSDSEGDSDSGIDQDEGGRRRIRKPSGPQRRSERTGRRDFSVLRSSLKNCLQLFLGPARFLNHDCENNVELYRKDSYVTFKVVRPIRIGQELTTYYGPDYFGRGNRECMCLTCEKRGSGYYKENPTKRTLAEAAKRAASEVATTRQDVDFDDEGVDTPMSTPRKSRLPTVSVADSPMAGSPSSDESEDEQDSKDGQSSKDDRERRMQPKRAARLKSKPLRWGMRANKQYVQRRTIENLRLHEDSESEGPEDPTDAGRCLTCAIRTKSLWVHKQEFLLCPRCSRHAMIFLLPWPAHRKADVREFPPSHLLPRDYRPPKVSDDMLPTYLPRPKPPLAQKVELAQQVANAKAAALLRATASDIPDSKEHRQARHRAYEYERDDYNFGQAAHNAWEMEVAKREAQLAKAQARERARFQRAETKRKLDEGKEKGVGLWARYVQETPEEREAREKSKYQFVTGTRSGRAIRVASEGEAEIERLARVALLKERDREKAQSEKQREWRERDKARRKQKVQNRSGDTDDESDASEQSRDLDALDELEELDQLPDSAPVIYPPSPAGPSTLPLQRAPDTLADKLLCAGGEEGDEDEDADNERLGREAGTRHNPVIINSDDDDDTHSIEEVRPRVKQEPQSANTARFYNPTLRRRSSGRAPLQTPPRIRQSGGAIDLAADSEDDSDIAPLPASTSFSASRRGAGVQARFSLKGPERAKPGSPSVPRVSNRRELIAIIDSDDEVVARRPLQTGELGSPQKPIELRDDDDPVRERGDDELRRKRGRPLGTGKIQKRKSFQEARAGASSASTSAAAERPKTSSPKRSLPSMYAAAAIASGIPNATVRVVRRPLRGASERSADEASPRDAASGEDDHEARSAESVEREIVSASSSRPAKRRAPAATGPERVTKKRSFFKAPQGLHLPSAPIFTGPSTRTVSNAGSR